MGQTRGLSREQAIEQYVILRMRSEEIHRLDYLLRALKSKRLVLPDGSPFSAADLADTVRTAFLGWFATLTDRHEKAIYAFNCLYVLFPNRALQVLRSQQSLEACHPELQQFRNNVAFHARSEIASHIKARMGLRGTDAFLDFCSAVSDFRRLMNAVESEELDSIPELPNILRQMGVAHLPAFARSLSREQQQAVDEGAAEAISDALNSCSLLPE
jgi:hypothetical protein